MEVNRKCCEALGYDEDELKRKSYFDLFPPEGRYQARRDFINDANKESVRLKQLMGLLSLPKTPAELQKDVERFMRHADTAERRHRAGAHRDLLADLDDETGDLRSQDTPENAADQDANGSNHNDFDDDSME